MATKAATTADVDKQASGAEAPAEAAAALPKGKRKKLVLFVALPMLLLVAAGGGGAYFTGMLRPLIGGPAGEEGAAEAPPSPSVFFDVPEMLVNLNSPGKKSNFLKIKVSLEMEDADAVKQIESVLPRVIDSFQVYLRELRIEDLNGSAGLFRLREELLQRVAAAAKPTKIRDVLFREMLVQ